MDLSKVKLEPPKKTRAKYPFQGYVDFQGLKVDVENKAGSRRKGVSKDERNRGEKVTAKGWVECSLEEYETITKGGAHKYVRRVRKPGGGYRYYYSDASTAHAAKEGERINLRAAGVRDVVGIRGGQVTLRDPATGKTSTVSLLELHGMMQVAYQDRMLKGAERMAARFRSTVKGLPKFNAKDPSSTFDAYADRFAKAKVDPEHAKSLVMHLANRDQWSDEARETFLAMASDPKLGRSVAGSGRQVIAGAENLRDDSAGKDVSGGHVAAAAKILHPDKAKGEKTPGDHVANLQAAAGLELAKAEALIAAVEASGGDKALMAYVKGALSWSAVPELATAAKAYPGIRDVPELAKYQELRGRFEAAQSKGNAVPSDGGRGIPGSETTVYIANKDGGATPQKGRYRLVEASELIPSHDSADRFKERKDYPKGIQTRGYHKSATERAKVTDNAKAMLSDLFVNTNPDAANGPPLMTSDGIILGGNSRTMSLQHAYSSIPEASEKYRKHLAENAPTFGIDPEHVKGMKNPILVREVETDTKDYGTLVQRYNEVFTASMDPRRDQVARARFVTPKMMDSLASGMEVLGKDGKAQHATLNAFLGSSGARPFTDSLKRAGIIDRRNHDQYIRPDGRLNEDGKMFVERILVGSVIPDPDTLSNMPLSQMNAIARSVPHIVRAAQSGHDIGPDLKQAIQVHDYMRRKKFSTVAEFDGSAELGDLMGGKDAGFSEKPKLSPVARSVLGVLTTKTGVNQMSDVFRRFAHHAKRNPAGQSSMFGVSKTTGQLLDEIVNPKVAKQSGLFAKGGRVLVDGERLVKSLLRSGWRECSEAQASEVWKGKGHRYIKRVPYTTKTGKKAYRYFYKVQHGGGVGHGDHMGVGSAFAYQGGHYHIVSERGGKVRIKHDETGKTMSVTRKMLGSMLRVEHSDAIKAHRERLKDDLAAAQKWGTRAQLARLVREAERWNVPVGDYQPMLSDEPDPDPAQDAPALPPATPSSLDDYTPKQIEALAIFGRSAMDLAKQTAEAKNASEAPPTEVEKAQAKSSVEKAKTKADADIEAGKVSTEPPEEAEPIPQHEEYGEHREGAIRDMERQRADSAAESRRERLLRLKNVSKAEVLGHFTIHDHVAKGGTIGGWHLKNWLIGQVAKKPRKVALKKQYVEQHGKHESSSESYVEMGVYLAQTLDKCLTVSDCTTALNEMQRHGVVWRHNSEPPPDGHIRYWSDWSTGKTGYMTPENGIRRGSMGKRFGDLMNQQRGRRQAWNKAVRQAEQIDRAGTSAEKYIKSQTQAAGYVVQSEAVNLERSGGREVHGVTGGNVTPESVAKHFSIGNVDFGKSMPQDERAEYLQKAGGALTDLADMMGMDPGSVGANGKLAIAFGARGRGGKRAAAAHYEPSKRIINLTRFAGGGTLAHEWAHFLDHQIGGNDEPRRNSTHYASNLQRPSVPERTREAYAGLTKAIKGSQFSADAKVLDGKKKRAYFSSWHEMFARLFEAHTHDTLSKQGRTNTYLVTPNHEMKSTGFQTHKTVATLRKHPLAAAANKASTEAFSAYRAELERDGSDPKRVDELRGDLSKANRQYNAALDVARDEFGQHEAQPYPHGDERAVLVQSMADLLIAMRSDGLLAQMMKAFTGRTTNRRTQVSKTVVRISGESICKGLLASGWVEVPESHGIELWNTIAKGKGHKYVKRIPYTKKNGKKGYRYFYHAGHGKGVHHEAHMVVGAAFMVDGGHYHVTAVSGGKVTIKHDETGEVETITTKELKSRLEERHWKAIVQHRNRTASELVDAAKYGTDKQLRAAAQRALASGAASGSASVDAIVKEQRKAQSEIDARADVPAGERSISWGGSQSAMSSRHHPADAGEIIKTGGKHVVVMSTSSHYIRDDGWSLGIQDEKGWAHSAKVRPATEKEAALYDAERAHKAAHPAAVKALRESVDKLIGLVKDSDGSTSATYDNRPSERVASTSRHYTQREFGNMRQVDVYQDEDRVMAGSHVSKRTAKTDAAVADMQAAIQSAKDAYKESSKTVGRVMAPNFKPPVKPAPKPKAKTKAPAKVKAPKSDAPPKNKVTHTGGKRATSDQLRAAGLYRNRYAGWTSDNDRVEAGAGYTRKVGGRYVVHTDEAAHGLALERVAKKTAASDAKAPAAAAAAGDPDSHPYLSKQGRHWHVTHHNSYGLKDKIKNAGAKWDRDARRWVARSRKVAERLTHILKGLNMGKAKVNTDTICKGLMASGWIEIPESHGEPLWLEVAKGAGHKYVKRVAYTRKNGKRGYKYFYHVGHGGGVGAGDHMGVGSAFQADGGHYHVTKVNGDKLTILHDETGEIETVTKDELAKRLKSHHKDAIATHQAKVKQEYADAMEHGTKKQQERAKKRAEGAGVKVKVKPIKDYPKATRGEPTRDDHASESKRHKNEAREASKQGDSDKQSHHLAMADHHEAMVDASDAKAMAGAYKKEPKHFGHKVMLKTERMANDMLQGTGDFVTKNTHLDSTVQRKAGAVLSKVKALLAEINSGKAAGSSKDYDRKSQGLRDELNQIHRDWYDKSKMAGVDVSVRTSVDPKKSPAKVKVPAKADSSTGGKGKEHHKRQVAIYRDKLESARISGDDAAFDHNLSMVDHHDSMVQAHTLEERARVRAANRGVRDPSGGRGDGDTVERTGPWKEAQKHRAEAAEHLAAADASKPAKVKVSKPYEHEIDAGKGSTPSPEEKHFLDLIKNQGGYVARGKPKSTFAHLLKRGLIHVVDGKYQVKPKGTKTTKKGPDMTAELNDFADIILGGETVHKAGPYIGKRGGKWADPGHKIPWKGDAKSKHIHAERNRAVKRGGDEHAKHSEAQDHHQELDRAATSKTAKNFHYHMSQHHKHMASAARMKHHGRAYANKPSGRAGPVDPSEGIKEGKAAAAASLGHASKYGNPKKGVKGANKDGETKKGESLEAFADTVLHADRVSKADTHGLVDIYETVCKASELDMAVIDAAIREDMRYSSFIGGDEDAVAQRCCDNVLVSFAVGRKSEKGAKVIGDFVREYGTDGLKARCRSIYRELKAAQPEGGKAMTGNSVSGYASMPSGPNGIAS